MREMEHLALRGWPQGMTAFNETRHTRLLRLLDEATSVEQVAAIRDGAAHWLASIRGRNMEVEREASDVKERASCKLAALIAAMAPG
jgi:hypothetical protein